MAKYCYVFVCIITPKTIVQRNEQRTERHAGSTPEHEAPRTCAVFNQTSNIVISKTPDGTVATDGTAASGI